MDLKRKDGIFRICGITGLTLLLILFIWARNRQVSPVSAVQGTNGNGENTLSARENSLPAAKSDQSTVAVGHDHADPASHGGDVKGKKLAHRDSSLKTSGNLIKGRRVVEYEAFKFAFAPDPLVVKSGETVVLKLKSRDVEHGIMIPELDFNASMPVGKTVTKSFIAPVKPGKYPIFCSTYCGTDHGNMRGSLVVLPADSEKGHSK